MSTPVILGVAGCSGSGKTTLADELARELEGMHFHLDHYYRDLSHLSYEERCRVNFDDPNGLEAPLLVQHVRQLSEGRPIDHPLYDFANHTRRKGETKRVEVDHLLIVDGIFALHYPDLRTLYHLSIYVDTPDEACYQRRLARDVAQRGRTPESVAEHYAESVRPMAEQYVRPSSAHADLIVEGTSSLDWSVEQVLSALKKKGLLEILSTR